MNELQEYFQNKYGNNSTPDYLTSTIENLRKQGVISPKQMTAWYDACDGVAMPVVSQDLKATAMPYTGWLKSL